MEKPPRETAAAFSRLKPPGANRPASRRLSLSIRRKSGMLAFRFMSEKSKRIVLKFGSGILAKSDGSALEAGQFRRLAAEVSALVKAGHECLIVSSGAVA